MTIRPLIAALVFIGPAAGGPPTDVHGDPLPYGAVDRIGTVRYRLGDVGPIALSPDGKTLAAESQRIITLWDVETGRPGIRIAGYGFQSTRAIEGPLAFTADGKHLVRVRDDNRVCVYDPATGKTRWTHEFKEGELDGSTDWLRVNPVQGTSRFAVTDRGRAVHVFDAASGRVAAHRWDVQSIRLAPSGRFFFAVNPAELVLIDSDTGAHRATLDLGSDASWPDLAVSPDGERLYALGTKGRLRTYDGKTGRLLEEINSPADWQGQISHGFGLALSPDGSVAYLSEWDRPTRRRDLKNGKWLDPLPVMPAGRLLPHPDGKRVLFVGDDGLLRRYDLATRQELPAPKGFEGNLVLAPSPDGSLVAAQSGPGGVDVFDLSGRPRWSMPPDGSPALACWAPDGKRLACVRPGDITLRDAADGTVRRSWTLADVLRGTKTREEVSTFHGLLLFTPDGGRLVATVSIEEGESPRLQAVVLDTATGTRVKTLDLGSCKAWALSPGGRTIAAAQPAGVRLIDVASGRVVEPAEEGVADEIPAVAFSPDGQWLLTWDPRGRAVLRDPDTGRRRRVIDVHQESVDGFAFSPDGLWLATGGADGLVALWDLVTGDQVWAQAGHAEAVTSVGFAGPRRLVTASKDLTGLVWDLRPDERLKGPAWDALAGPDPRAAYQAIWALADDPAGPRLLRSKISPVPLPPPGAIRQWVADLAAPRYAVRETATNRLREAGRLAEPDLRAERARTTDEEVRTRLDAILAKLPRERERDRDELTRARAVAAMELAGTPAAKKLLAEWAAGAPGARLTIDAKAALARLGANP